jgi:uncharacterized membrane protein
VTETGARAKQRRERRCASNDRGSALMLVPASILVVFVLGAIAVDTANLRLHHREAHHAADAAANDAVAAGLDLGQFRDSGTLQLDPTHVVDIVGRSVAASDVADVVTAPPEVRITTVDGRPQVTVTLTVRADYIFAGVLPVTSDSADIRVTSTAELRER